jgi:RNA polymerase sigma-70 factor (ECF subfamily)
VSTARARAARSAARPDDELLAELAKGDLGALGELYDRYARDVWRAVLRMLGNDADVDDVVHSVFLKLPQIAVSYDGRAHARAWIIGIAVRIALRHRRSMKRFAAVLAGFAHTLAGSSPNPEKQAAERDELRAFERAFVRLSPKKRAVFSLVELEGLTTDEVAGALEIPASTVRTRLHHARAELQAAFERRRGI